jgi:hypothetical protein
MVAINFVALSTVLLAAVAQAKPFTPAAKSTGSVDRPARPQNGYCHGYPIHFASDNENCGGCNLKVSLPCPLR